MKLWPVTGVLLLQLFLVLVHGFLCWAGCYFWPLSPQILLLLRVTLAVLAFSFIPATYASFHWACWPVAWFYRIAAVWLGFLNYFVWAACLGWIFFSGLRLVLPEAQAGALRPWIGALLTAAAVLAGFWGLVCAQWICVRRVAVQLDGLPPAWRGRRALVISDLHLGPINGRAFAQRIANMAAELKPEIVLIPGDLFDGGAVDPEKVLAPFAALKPPLGIYFSAGNHDEFGDMRRFTAAMERAGIRILSREAVNIDGLSLLGIPFSDSSSPIRFRAVLNALKPEPGTVAVLLSHAPVRLPIIEEAGIALLLSGHTHAGQLLPFTWMTRRVFGSFTDGFSRYGALSIYTSTGAGTWGPPMRIGSRSEIALLDFE